MLSNSTAQDNGPVQPERVEALRRSEERYRALLEATSQAVWSWATDGSGNDFERSRQWWTEITGQPLDEQGATGDAWLEVVHAEDRSRAGQAWATAKETGSSYESEYRVRSRHGDWRHVRARGIPVHADDGSVREWIGTLDDVTTQRDAGAERDRLLAEVDAERRRLQEIFNHAPSFMAVLRGPEHIFERVNDRYVELIGGRNVVGLPVRKALPEIEGQGYFELLDQVYRTGEPHVEVDARVVLVHSQDSREHILQFVYQPMLDINGKVSGVIVQGIDMTEQRRAERDLVRLTEESDRRKRLYETFLSSTPDLAYVFDLNHRFTYANDVLLQMWGRTWDEAIGKTCLELGYEPWHAAMHGEEIDKVKATCAPIRGEVPFNGAFGRRIYDYIFVPVFGANGEVEAVAGTTRDVTERKESEQALRDADRKKDDFLALLAHELRNPLAPIRNGLQVMRLAQGNPGMVATARDMMERQLGHMVRLIDDLLDVSRITRNKMELRCTRVILADVIGNAVEASSPMIQESGHELTVVLPPEPIVLEADLTRLAQVFSNMLSNSAKYTPQGGKIWLSAERAGQEVIVSVRDTGIGIPEHSLSSIFDMFSQVDRNIERSKGGLGIGLALVKGLVEMHGGTVAADSVEGKGSTFTVRLPIFEPIATSDTTTNEADVTHGSKRRMLVVDDNRDGADSMAIMLRLLGNEVTTAHDGLEAVAAAGAVRPEVILMDIGLPRLSGLDATRQIREQPWGREIKIIALTGWGQENDREQSRKAGCDGHLVKPVDLSDLEKLLESVRHR
ncbi:MAG TPA: PAS domain S-box protein [Schlesneria sp.]